MKSCLEQIVIESYSALSSMADDCHERCCGAIHREDHTCRANYFSSSKTGISDFEVFEACWKKYVLSEELTSECIISAGILSQ